MKFTKSILISCFSLMLLSVLSPVRATSMPKGEDKVNDPVLVLMDDITVCSGGAILLPELPLVEVNGLDVEISYHTATPVGASNEIFTETIVLTSNDTIYAQAINGTCSSILEIPIEFVTSPVLVLNETIRICSGEIFDLGTLNILDNENTGAPISFHSSNNPTSDNELTSLMVSPVVTSNVYAYSKLGSCEYVLPISINVTPSPNLFVTTEPVICSGLDFNLGSLQITDLNNTGAPWTLHFDLPATTQNQINESILNFSNSTTIYAVAQSGECPNELPISVTVTSSLYAGEDETGSACINGPELYLGDLITPSANPGVFVPMGSVPFFNPITNTIDTKTAVVGTYQFQYLVEAEGSCLPDEALITVEILPAANAGFDVMREICEGALDNQNLADFLNGASSTNGVWRQLIGETVDVSNSISVDLSIVEADTLVFQYILEEDLPCSADTSTIVIDVTPMPRLDGTERRCATDLLSYDLVFWTEYSNITTDFGTIVTIDATERNILNIPITQSIHLTITNEKGCVNVMEIVPPDCSCAYVPKPLQIQNISTCIGDPVSPLSAVIANGYGANWYDELEDGILLFGNGTSFSPGLISPGIYIYYIEVYDLNDPSCIGESRYEAVLEIFEYPPEVPLDISGCVSAGIASFDFEEIALDISPEGETEYFFYTSMADAENDVNVLPMIFETPVGTLPDLWAAVVNGGICRSIVEVNLSTSPNPDVEFYINNVSCGTTPDGAVGINILDPTQNIEMSFNGQAWTTNTEIFGLYGGTNQLRVRNEFGCIISELLTVETSTGFEIVEFEFTCDGNGTPADATDDFQVMSIRAETTTSSTGFDLYNGTDLIGTYTFGVVHEINLAADGTYYSLEFIDHLDPICKEFKVLGELETCSTQCGITDVRILGGDCDDNNTPFDPFDDKFYLDVEVRSVNASDGWKLTGALQYVGEYGGVTTVGPFSIADHEGILVFQDNENSNCFFELNFDIPAPCSGQCEVDIVEFNQINCDDAFTGPIIIDDIYFVSFIMSNKNIGKDSFMLEYNGDISGPYLYDELVEFKDVEPNATEITLLLFDLEDQGCVEEFTVLLTPCSFCSEITQVQDDALNLNCIAEAIYPEVEVSMNGAYSWSVIPSGVNSFTELSPGFTEIGSYELLVNHDNLCESRDTLEVVQNNVIPVAEAGLSQVINCIDTSVQLIGTTVHPSNFVFEWYDQNNVLLANIDTLNTSIEGTYSLFVIDTLRKCTSLLDEVLVTRNDVLPNLTINIFPSDTISCFADEIQISPEGDLSGLDVSWQSDLGPVFADFFVVNSAGNYTVDITDPINGCVQTIGYEILSDDDIPEINLVSLDTINCINEIVSINAAGSSNDQFISYQWYDESKEEIENQADESLDVNSGGFYYLELMNSDNGCMKIDSIFVIQDQMLPSISAGDDSFILCYSDEYVLDENVDSPLDNYSLNWSSLEGNVIDQSSSFGSVITEPGSYIMQVVNNENYCVAIDTVVITNDPSDILSAEIVSLDPFCFGDTNGMIIVQEVESGGSDIKYRLDGQFSPDENVFENLIGGDYRILITNEEGCSFDSIVTIYDPYQLELSFSVEDQQIINLGDTLEVTAITNMIPEDIAILDWGNTESIACDTCLENLLFPYEPTTYNLELTDLNGCSISQELSIFVTDEVFIYLPNVLDLTETNLNSELLVYGKGQVSEILHLEVYDRWGSKLFVSSNFSPGEEGRGWDGTYLGTKVSPGVYMYRVEYLMKNGKVKQFIGDVTVFR